jgi:hypothetical protein
MTLGPGSTWKNAAAYLLGSYEAELHAVIEEVISRQPATVVDVGAAEGYYAVGLARRLPEAVVHAIDPDARAQAVCVSNAEANGVRARVHVHGRLRHEELERLLAHGALLVCDCEGCELELLDPAAVPSLRSTFRIVELHEFVDPEIGAIISGRFAATHDVQMITAQQRDPHDYPDAPSGDATWLLDERRPVEPHPMRWAVCRPKTEPS